jgi:hypothetical protein
MVLSEKSTRHLILGLHRRLNWFVHKLYDIACGQDLKMFILVKLTHFRQRILSSFSIHM